MNVNTLAPVETATNTLRHSAMSTQRKLGKRLLECLDSEIITQLNSNNAPAALKIDRDTFENTVKELHECGILEDENELPKFATIIADTLTNGHYCKLLAAKPPSLGIVEEIFLGIPSRQDPSPITLPSSTTIISIPKRIQQLLIALEPSPSTPLYTGRPNQRPLPQYTHINKGDDLSLGNQITRPISKRIY